MHEALAVESGCAVAPAVGDDPDQGVLWAWYLRRGRRIWRSFFFQPRSWLTQHEGPGRLARSLHSYEACVSRHTAQRGSCFFSVGMATAPVPVIGPFQGQRTLQPGLRGRNGADVEARRRGVSSGGFAQVYLVEADVPVPIPGHEHRDTTLVLKHMCVGNQEARARVRGDV